MQMYNKFTIIIIIIGRQVKKKMPRANNYQK